MICPICKKAGVTAGHILGHSNAGKPRNVSAEVRSKRAEWARGLAKIRKPRKAKSQAVPRSH